MSSSSTLFPRVLFSLFALLALCFNLSAQNIMVTGVGSCFNELTIPLGSGPINGKSFWQITGSGSPIINTGCANTDKVGILWQVNAIGDEYYDSRLPVGSFWVIYQNDNAIPVLYHPTAAGSGPPATGWQLVTGTGTVGIGGGFTTPVNTPCMCTNATATMLSGMSVVSSSGPRIEEIYNAGGTGNYYPGDYIILSGFAANASLTGKSIQARGSGTTWVKVDLTGNADANGKVYLVSSASVVTMPFTITQYLPSITLSRSGSSQVALMDNTTLITSSTCPSTGVLDLVGYLGDSGGGNPPCFEGTGPAPISNPNIGSVTNQSIRRKMNGTQDNNDNSADFEVITNPYGSSTPTVNLSVSPTSGTEAAQTSITVTATASAPVTSAQTVTLTVTGTDITTGDYTLNNMITNTVTITIPINGTTGTATFKVVDDIAVEATETATLTISNPSSGITLGSNTTLGIPITDNDVYADLALVKSVNDNTPDQNQVITFTLVVSNAGPGIANSVTVTDVLPSGMTFLSGSQTGDGTYDSSNPSTTGLKWQNITISNGGTKVLTFQATVTAAGGTSITNFAQVTSSSQADPDSTPNNGNIGEDDGDIATVTVSPTVNLSVSTNTATEAGATVVTVTATASAAVVGNQTVSLGVSGTGITGGDYNLSNTTITILSGQTTGSVTFTIVNDALDEANETATLTIGSPSTGIALGTMITKNVAIEDDDEAGVTVTEPGGTNVTEGGATDTYTVVLTSEPTANVTVNINAGTQVTTSPTSLTFTSANWNSPQTVTVTAVDDATVEGAHTGTITHTTTSSDANYNAASVASVVANITDNDAAAVCTASIMMNNGPICSGQDAVFTVTGTAGATLTYHTGSGNMMLLLTGASQTITVPNATENTPGATTNGVVAHLTLTLVSVSTTSPSCTTPLSATSVVDIYDKPTISPIPALAARCAGSPITLPTGFVVATNGSPLTTVNGILWQLEDGPGTNTFTNINLPYPTSFADNGKKFRLAATNGCGTTYSNELDVIIYNVNTASAGTTTTLCINALLSPNITHTTTGATGISNAGVSGANGLPAGVSASWSSNTITISGTPTASGTFSYSIPLTGGCGTVSATGTIVVTANNTASAGTTTTLCINTLLSPNITHTTTGATGISNAGVSGANGLPAGVSASWASNTITISGTPTASGTFSYSIPLTGGCGTVNATGTITVTPDNSAGVASSTPTLCINTALTAITHTTTGATGISNAGVSGANGLPAGVSASWASNTITISGTPTASGTFSYSIPLTGGCGTVNATGTITVTPDNSAGVASSTPTLCINTALTAITHATAGATGISNAGVSGANGLPAGVSASWSSNTITISGTPTESGTFSYSIPLTGGCGTVNATGTITVNPLPAATINFLPFLCKDSTITLSSAVLGGTGPYTYSWTQTGGAGSVQITNNNDGTASAKGLGFGEVEISFSVQDNNGCVIETPATRSLAVVDCAETIYKADDPCTCKGGGLFDEEVTVSSPFAGETWTVVELAPLRAGGTAPGNVAVGNTLTYNNTTQKYEIVFEHTDSSGYVMAVEGPNVLGSPRNVKLSIENVCYYPDVAINNVPVLVSPNAAPFTVIGAVFNIPEDDELAGTGILTLNPATPNQLQEEGTAPTSLTINPASLPLGTNILTYSFDAGKAGMKNLNDPGCVSTVQKTFQVANCGCQDVTVSLDANCQFLLTGNLVSDANCNRGTVRVMDNDPSNGGVIDCAGVWTYGLFDSFGNIICWGKVTAEDKTAPAEACMPANVTLDCYDVNYVLNNHLTIGDYGTTSSPRPAPTSKQTILNAEGNSVVGGPCSLPSGMLVSDKVANLGYAYFLDNCRECGCRVTLKWSDKVVFYSCEEMED
ncbi:MAG: hypothetical protein SFV55_01520, partial [Haliscomenobacter sp.]|uniref:beta strand repeat-containing protein n=1 Tax=Haliscomenobacter sp. TaxID=2717303 RepID=UPI0029A03F08|nr:hypothetical protein [Haliscomenobacter sp.]